MITFSKALPLFAIMITAICTSLLLKSKPSLRKGYSPPHRITLILTFFLALLGAILTLALDFRESLPYYVMLIITTASITALSPHIGPRGRGLLLCSILMWQLMILYDQVPEACIALGEGTQMTRFMVKNGVWEFGAAHNPSYNPLPTVAFIITALDYATSLPWYNWFLVFSVFYLSLIVAYDLTIFSLTKEVTGSSTAGILAILLLTLTPQTNPLMHPYQWSGNLLVLISSLMFIRAVSKRKRARGAKICMIVSFASAILAHATAGMSTFLPFMAIMVGYFSLHALKSKEPSAIAVVNLRSSVLFTGALLLVIALARAVHTSGYVEYILPSLSAFFRELFFPEAIGPAGEAWYPLYERAGINPIQAYAWVLAPSLATALILTDLLKKKVEFWHLTLYVTAIVFIASAYLQAAFSHAPTVKFNRLAYVWIPFMIPMGALALVRVLKGGRLIGVVSLALVLIAAPIATHDPNVSWRQYAEIRGGRATLSIADLTEAHSLLQLLDNVSEKLYIRSLECKGYAYLPSGERVEVLRNSLEEALNTIAFIHDIKLPKLQKLTIVDREFSKVYDSERSSVFMSK